MTEAHPRTHGLIVIVIRFVVGFLCFLLSSLLKQSSALVLVSGLEVLVVIVIWSLVTGHAPGGRTPSSGTLPCCGPLKNHG